MKVRDWAMLNLYKGCSISSSFELTKKLTQQYIGPFQIVKRVGRLVDKLELPSDWRIHLVFSMAQLEPALDPSEDPFWRSCPQ